ncbi:Slp family lipoprotein [Nitrosovibrio sp. Nv6]|uniref:Slp family lipoprotein n=1 Tax=Nitrosovibrio sp. Nv6 TaxID=1855340 RepID=UPI0008B8E464|nr:Slp family lipoprotein [Nitrosovibrio sp. Nv6]SEO86914.1 outer membrane lipoprotein [Nitrosovibrio sp. Nv6]
MRLYSLLVCLSLSACAGLPAAVKDVPVADITYSQASQNPDSYKDTSVRWGGVIIEVENEENFTLVQVLSYPLNYSGRPQVNKPSEGRFVIKSSQFLDPAVYAKDREITVAGTLEGDIQRMIGKKAVQLPLLSSKAIYLWPVYQAYPYGYGYGGYGYGFSPYFGYGYYGSPFYWGGYYRPYW